MKFALSSTSVSPATGTAMAGRSRQKNTPLPRTYESFFEHSALFEFSRVINSSLEPKFILSHILLTIMGKMLSMKGMILLEYSPGVYSVEMVKGFANELLGLQVRIGKIPQLMFYVDTINRSRHPWVKFFKGHSVRILLPMIIADRPIGFLAFGELFPRKKLTRREETYLRSLANISATAVEKSRTVDQIRKVNRTLDQKVQELHTLFDLGKEFGALLDPDKQIKLLVFSLLGQIGVYRYLICLKQGSDMRVVASRIDGSEPQHRVLTDLATRTKPALLDDLPIKDVPEIRQVLGSIGMKVVVPMQVQGETRGLILLGEKLSREEFTAANMEFLSSLANLAMIALENARLFKDAIEKQRLEDELLIAREIQKGLLPSTLPNIPGLSIAAVNISSNQVGGDYYDVLQLSSENWIIAIGDVSGKGTPAALLMANLQATIRALVPLQIPLGELTGRVNDLMCQNTGGTKFVTFFWGIVDSGKMTLTYVNAGHNYPILLKNNGSIRRLDVGGMILGVLNTVTPYEEATVPFDAGDLLVLFTDGVSEAMNRERQEYGEDRLKALVQAHGPESAQQVMHAIHLDIQLHAAGAPQSDDITMMIVKVVER